MQSLCTNAACSLDAYALYRRLCETDSGDLSAGMLGVTPDAGKPGTGTGLAMLQLDKHVKLEKQKASDDQQSQRVKLASQASAGGQPCPKEQQRGKDSDLQGQVKSKNKKKNRLGQRARQQLGRAKQAGLDKIRPNRTFMVSHIFLRQHCLMRLLSLMAKTWVIETCFVHSCFDACMLSQAPNGICSCNQLLGRPNALCKCPRECTVEQCCITVAAMDVWCKRNLALTQPLLGSATAGFLHEGRTDGHVYAAESRYT